MKDARPQGMLQSLVTVPCAERSAGASGHIGSILCPAYMYLMPFEMPQGIQGIYLGASDVTQDLWEICALLKQQLAAR